MDGLNFKSPGSQVAYSAVKSFTRNSRFDAVFSILARCLFEIMSYKFYLKTSNKWLNLDLHNLKAFRPNSASHKFQDLEKDCAFLM